MKTYVRAVAVQLLVVFMSAGATAQTKSESEALWSDLTVPGTPAGFARTASLNLDTLGPTRLMLEFIRVHGLPEASGGDRIGRVENYLTVLERFLAAEAALGTSDISLTLATHSADLFRGLLKSIGLTVTNRKGSPAQVGRNMDRSANDVRAVFADAGLNLDGIEDRLNAGESIKLELPSFTVPLPMTPQWWSYVVFGQQVPPERLFHAIIADDKASFLYYGLASVDPATRAYLAATPKLVSKIYTDHAGLFAVFGGSLRVRDSEVDVPGGRDAVDFWQVLVGDKITKPDRFIESVLSADSGRVAYFYHLIDSLDSGHVRFALGLHEGSSKRSQRQWVDSVYGWFNIPDPFWIPHRRPFASPRSDPSLLLIQVAVDDTGRPHEPASRFLWEAVFDSTSLPDRPERQLKARAGKADAPFWIEAVFGKSQLDPHDRLDTLLFAQRVFGAASEQSAGDMLVSLRAFPRFRMLELTLERMGVRSPEVYAAAVRRAANLSDIQNADIAVASISQFQGAISLIERATLSKRLSLDDAVSCLTSLVAVELESDGSYGANIARWIDHELIPTVAAASLSVKPVTVERRLLAGLAGLKELKAIDSPDAAGPFVEWEGWQYLVDPSAGLFDRMSKVRERQAGNSLDMVLTLEGIVTVLSGNPTMEDVRSQSAVVKQLQGVLREPRPPVALTDSKVVTAKNALSAAVGELDRIKNVKQFKGRVKSAQAWLESLTAVVTADVLREIVYAMHINDPDTVLLIEGDVSHRHDLGLAAQKLEAREHTAWALPKQQAGQGTKFHVTGALLGLDLALADLTLKRAVVGKPPSVSSWSLSNEITYTQLIALFNPFDPRLNDMGLVADAIRKGRNRIARLASDRTDLNAIYDVARIGALRRSLISWALDRDPPTAQRLFSLAELVRIGGDEASYRAATAWGASAIPLNGCLCLALGAAVDWELFSGSDTPAGLLAAGSPDLLLRYAELLAELKLPAALATDIVPFGVRATLDESHLDYENDWLTVMRTASSLSQRTLEDYVSRITAGGSMIPVAAVVK